MASLSEKLQAQDVTIEPITGQKTEPLSAEMGTSFQFSVKVEDRLSTGSAWSAVVDEDAPHLVDSGDSYFPSDEYPGCVGPVYGVQPDEDDGSDDGQSYFSNVFAATQQQQHEEPLGWCVWS